MRKSEAIKTSRQALAVSQAVHGRPGAGGGGGGGCGGGRGAGSGGEVGGRTIEVRRQQVIGS